MGNNKEKVDIWMVTYNHKEYISKAIESVLMQKTNFRYKLIIGEDNSTDGTRKIVKKYHKNNPDKINVIYNNKNLGPKNNGFQVYKACKAKYMALLEGDDFWTDPYKLQKQVDFLEANPEYSMCVHNAIVSFEGNHNKDYFFNPANQKNILATMDLVDRWSFATASIVLRKEMLDRTNSQELSAKHQIYNGDLFLSLLMSLQGPIKYLPNVMSVYRRFNLERYKGKEVFFLNRKIKLFEIFNRISNNKYDYLINKKILFFNKKKAKVNIRKRSKILYHIMQPRITLGKVFNKFANLIIKYNKND